jgi:hypothetical protein
MSVDVVKFCDVLFLDHGHDIDHVHDIDHGNDIDLSC